MARKKSLNVSLWGDEFDLNKASDSELIEKIKSAKDKSVIIKKQLTSDNITKGTQKEILNIIKEDVYKKLGKYVNNTIVIKTRDELRDYISTSISNNILALDTETNNSLDPITCKIMGACLYTKGMPQAYVPINHIDIDTRERLSWQLTENDLKEEFQRLIDNNTRVIYHNYKFDYQVIKCTCDIEVPCYWDTIIGAKLIDENEEANLKTQYVLHIDKNEYKYDIEELFGGVEYAIVEPSLFALYAATDSYKTYKLYLYQKDIIFSEDYKKIKDLFFNIEIPCIKSVAEMELNGVEIDIAYAKRLQPKYHNLLNNIEKQIRGEIDKHKDEIQKWRLSDDAKLKPKVYATDKDKKTYNFTPKGDNSKFLKRFPLKEQDGKEIKYYYEQKSKSEQLSDDIDIDSPTQLSILLYDIFKVPSIDKKAPRGTGKDILEELDDMIDLPILNMILEYKKMSKLISSFIDVLPNELNNKTHRIHSSYNQYGAKTGRFSCNEPNLQQVPSHAKDVRMMFKASENVESDVFIQDNYYEISKCREVLTKDGWKKVPQLKVNDIILGDYNEDTICKIELNEDIYKIYVI